MATLKNDQYQLWSDQFWGYSGVDVGGGSGIYQYCQSFTPSVSGTLDSVMLAMGKSNGMTANLIITLYLATVLGKPTGSALATQTIAAADVGYLAYSTYPKLVVTFSSPASLTAGIKYVIVASAPDAPAYVIYRWRASQLNIYSGGEAYMSSDGGATWTLNTNSASMTFLTTMSTVVATPGLDQFAFGGQDSYQTDYRVDTAGMYKAQTFTPSVTATLKNVTVPLRRVDGQTAGTVTVEIHATDGVYKPTGAALASYVIADIAIPTTSQGYVTVTFASPPLLTMGTLYAIVLKFNDVDATHKYDICITTGASDTVVDQYPGGTLWQSSNSGVSWINSMPLSNLAFVTFMLESATQTESIDSDAIIYATSSPEINADAFCGAETQKAILADTDIITTIEQTIDSNAFCGTTATNSVNADSTIKATSQASLTADAKVAITSVQTIDSDAKVLAAVTKMICAQAIVAITTVQITNSDAFIYRAEPVLKLYVAV